MENPCSTWIHWGNDSFYQRHIKCFYPCRATNIPVWQGLRDFLGHGTSSAKTKQIWAEQDGWSLDMTKRQDPRTGPRAFMLD